MLYISTMIKMNRVINLIKINDTYLKIYFKNNDFVCEFIIIKIKFLFINKEKFNI